MEADNNFGVFLGTDYKAGDVWSLNLEARFIDETAISFGGTDSNKVWSNRVIIKLLEVNPVRKDWGFRHHPF